MFSKGEAEGITVIISFWNVTLQLRTMSGGIPRPKDLVADSDLVNTYVDIFKQKQQQYFTIISSTCNRMCRLSEDIKRAPQKQQWWSASGLNLEAE